MYPGKAYPWLYYTPVLTRQTLTYWPSHFHIKGNVQPLEAMPFYQPPSLASLVQCGLRGLLLLALLMACIPGSKRPIVLSLGALGAAGKWGVVQHAGNLNSSQKQVAR